MGNPKRMDYLDGIKGIACIVVFLYHFHIFFGYTFVGLEAVLVTYPFSLLADGQFAVALFCFISGFTIVIPLYRKKDLLTVQKTLFKRYFRLLLPVGVSCVLILLLSKGGLFFHTQAIETLGNDWIGGHFQALTLRSLWESVLYGIWWKGNSTFNGPFWMLNKVFMGSFLAIIAATMVIGVKKSRALCLLGAMMVLFLFVNAYYFGFLLGVTLAYIYYETNFYQICKERKWTLLLWIPLLAVGIFLPGRAEVMIEALHANGIPIGPLSDIVVFYMIAAFCWIAALLGMSGLQRIFAARPCVWLGKCGFAVYLIHWPLICSFSSFLYLKLQFGVMNPHIMKSVIFVATTIVLLILSHFFNYVIEEKFANKVVAKITAMHFD